MLISIIFALLATMAFGIIFNAPRKTLPALGFVGAAGWAVFILMRDVLGYSSPVSNFGGTMVLAVLSELFARLFRQPVTVFAIPGIIPLVPGLPIYQGMVYLLMNAYGIGMEKLISASVDAGAISLGILLISSLFRVFKVRRDKLFLAKHSEVHRAK
ncbi:MAG: threonine/serine exporter family protein [Acidaminococcaceae bacterium]